MIAKFMPLLAAAALLVACGEAQESADQAAGAAQDAVETAGEVAGDLAERAGDAAEAAGDKVHAALSAHEGEVLVTGTLGCGHCTYNQGETCSAAMQTADGTVYILDGVTTDEEAFNQRFSGKEIVAVGTVVPAEGEGAAHLKVREYNM